MVSDSGSGVRNSGSPTIRHILIFQAVALILEFRLEQERVGSMFPPCSLSILLVRICQAISTNTKRYISCVDGLNVSAIYVTWIARDIAPDGVYMDSGVGP